MLKTQAEDIRKEVEVLTEHKGSLAELSEFNRGRLEEINKFIEDREQKLSQEKFSSAEKNFKDRVMRGQVRLRVCNNFSWRNHYEPNGRMVEHFEARRSVQVSVAPENCRQPRLKSFPTN